MRTLRLPRSLICFNTKSRSVWSASYFGALAFHSSAKQKRRNTAHSKRSARFVDAAVAESPSSPSVGRGARDVPRSARRILKHLTKWCVKLLRWAANCSTTDNQEKLTIIQVWRFGLRTVLFVER